MDDQYLDAVIRENEEGITDLNNSLLGPEGEQEDQTPRDVTKSMGTRWP